MSYISLDHIIWERGYILIIIQGINKQLSAWHKCKNLFVAICLRGVLSRYSYKH